MHRPMGAPVAGPQGAIQSLSGAQQGAAGGVEAQGRVTIGFALLALQHALGSFPTGSPEHSDVMKALQSLSRHAPSGISTSQIGMSILNQLRQGAQRMALLGHAAGMRQGAAMASQPQGQAPQISSPIPGV